MTDEFLGQIIDPADLQEFFADGVTIAVRDGTARLIFLVDRPRFNDSGEPAGSEARVVARIALTPAAAQSLVEGLDRAFQVAMDSADESKPKQ
ncbi:MAG: hypothetical protein ACTSWI_01985 [Alphaproteobacteria bacterium]